MIGNLNNIGKIPIVLPKRIRWIEVGKIMWFEANGNGSLVFLTDGTVITSKKILKHYSEMLHENGFYRIHDRFLVKLTYVDSQTRGSNVKVIMLCDNKKCRWNRSKLQISVRKRKEFENFILFKVNNMQIKLNDTLIAN